MDKKLIENVKEAAILVGISAAFGFFTKKMLKKSLIDDPSSSLMHAATWVAVLTGSLYARDYLIKENILSQSP